MHVNPLPCFSSGAPVLKPPAPRPTTDPTFQVTFLRDSSSGTDGLQHLVRHDLFVDPQADTLVMWLDAPMLCHRCQKVSRRSADEYARG